MERCGFFDAHMVNDKFDREYFADTFAAYFASFIGNGIFGNKSDALQVVARDKPTMEVEVLSGQGWINGYWYENMDNAVFAIDMADGYLNRIDIVVLRLGYTERGMWLEVRKGVPATSPKAPDIIRNADYYELQLAKIAVQAGNINIKSIHITDTRLLNDVCGLVCGVVQQFNTQTFGQQLQTFINDYIAKANRDYVPYTDELARLVKLSNLDHKTYKQGLDDLSAQSDAEHAEYKNHLDTVQDTADSEHDAYKDALDGLQQTADDEHVEYKSAIDMLRADSNAYKAQYVKDIDNLKKLANGAYNEFLAYLDGLQKSGYASYVDFLNWLVTYKDDTIGKVNELMERLNDIAGGNVTVDALDRILRLERRLPVKEVAEIEHNLDSYVQCVFFAYDYGAGCGDPYAGPAGGTPLASEEVSYSQQDRNHITIYAKDIYGDVDTVVKLEDNIYMIVFVNSITTLLAVLERINMGGIS